MDPKAATTAKGVHVNPEICNIINWWGLGSELEGEGLPIIKYNPHIKIRTPFEENKKVAKM